MRRFLSKRLDLSTILGVGAAIGGIIGGLEKKGSDEDLVRKQVSAALSNADQASQAMDQC
jgi:hypothetical protein